MRTVLDILHKAGGWRHGLYISIPNQPYMNLLIEAMGEPGPCGLPSLSVSHYGERNGDLTRDPEMCFELGFAGGAHLNPFYWRNDYVEAELWSRFVRDGLYHYHTELHKEHENFAKLWDKNLRRQGFADVFDPSRHMRQ